MSAATITQAANMLSMPAGSPLTDEAIDHAYRVAASKYHPDRGGSTQMMQAVNAARATLKAAALAPGLASVDDYEATDYGDALNAAINAALSLAGLECEVCGNWLWVSGDTRTHRDALKAGGFKWAPAKLKWYFRPAEWKSVARGSWDMDKIRDRYGSEQQQRQQRAALAA